MGGIPVSTAGPFSEPSKSGRAASRRLPRAETDRQRPLPEELLGGARDAVDFVLAYSHSIPQFFRPICREVLPAAASLTAPPIS